MEEEKLVLMCQLVLLNSDLLLLKRAAMGDWEALKEFIQESPLDPEFPSKRTLLCLLEDLEASSFKSLVQSLLGAAFLALELVRRRAPLTEEEKKSLRESAVGLGSPKWLQSLL